MFIKNCFTSLLGKKEDIPKEKEKSKNLLFIGPFGHTAYYVVALFTALGAPLGWALIETVLKVSASGLYRGILYMYLFLGTAMAFSIFAGLTLAKVERERLLREEVLHSKQEIERKEEVARQQLVLTKEKMLHLNQIGAHLGKAQTEEELYYRLAQAVHVALGFDRVNIFKKEEEHLIIIEARGIKMEKDEELKELENLKLPCSESAGALGIACREKRSFIFGLNDYIPPQYRLKPPYNKIEAIRSKAFLILPIVVEGEEMAHAVIAADRKHRKEDVTSEDLATLGILADIAGTTLTRIKLEKELEVLATIDSLTGIYNRRAWMELAEREFRRAKRYKQAFSVVMLDIDDFKEVNDTWGHQSGDKVLARIGEILRTKIRDVDYPGRYGGEEFIILLPHTEGNGGYELAERLRKEIENADMGVPKRITATFGVSVYTPENDIKTLDEILLKVDKALYYGKSLGKNRVIKAWEMEVKK